MLSRCCRDIIEMTQLLFIFDSLSSLFRKTYVYLFVLLPINP